MALRKLPTVSVPISWGLQAQPEMRVITDDFGDGYSIYAPDGLNSVRETFNPKWVGMDEDEAFELYDFLKSTKGAEFIDFDVPREGRTISVVVSQPRISWDEWNSYTVSCSLRQVFTLL